MNWYEVTKPGDPYHRKLGELVEQISGVDKPCYGTLRFPDGMIGTYLCSELRAVIRIRV